MSLDSCRARAFPATRGPASSCPSGVHRCASIPAFRLWSRPGHRLHFRLPDEASRRVRNECGMEALRAANYEDGAASVGTKCVKVTSEAGEKLSYLVRGQRDLERLLNVLGAGGGGLKGEDGSVVTNVEDLRDGGRYTILRAEAVAKRVRSVTLKFVADKEDSTQVLNFRSLSQSHLSHLMDMFDVVGFLTPRPNEETQLICSVAEMDDNGTYIGMPRSTSSWKKTVDTLLKVAENRTPGLEDRAGRTLMDLARAENPCSEVMPLPMKKFKDKTEKVDVIEIDAGAVVRPKAGHWGQKVFYFLDHKQSLGLDEVFNVCNRVRRLGRARDASPQLAAALEGVNHIKPYVCADLVVGETEAGKAGVIAAATREGLTVILPNGEDYSVVAEAEAEWKHDLP